MSFTKRIPIEQRFLKHFVRGSEVECWLWTGGKQSDGYGAIGVGGRTNKKIGAHRLAWELSNGNIPKGLHVLHKCDNPPCVNPSHLRVGTNLENMQDRGRKGRCKARGLPGMHVKLTPEQVIEIRKRGDTQENLARKYGVSKGAISSIWSGKSWKHLFVKTMEAVSEDL